MPLNASRIAEIRRELQARETEDLLEIWQQQNIDEWTPEAFEAIRQILINRLGELPALQPPDQTDAGAGSPKRVSPPARQQQRDIRPPTVPPGNKLSPPPASSPRVAEIYRQMKLRDTEDLCEIWQAQNYNEWTEEAFEAIRAILIERLGELPAPQPNCQTTGEMDSPQALAGAMPHLRKSIRRLDAGRIDQALKACIAALQIAPNLAEAYNQLGLIYDAQDRPDEAIAAYREAVRLAPNYKDAQANLLDAESEAQEDPALDRINQAIDLAENDDFESALAECDQAIALAPRLAEAHNYRGMILQQLNRLPEAIDAYRQAFEIQPDFYAARENHCTAHLWYLETLYSQSLSIEEEFDAETMMAFARLETAAGDTDGAEEFPASSLWSVEDVLQTPALYLDERAILLGGWPGHRIRPGRSGYDPLDAYFEEAHIEGVLLRSLFTGRCLTNNFFYLLLMTLFGFLAVSPLVLIIADLKSVDPFVLAVVSPYVVVGLVVLANVLISLASLSDGEAKFITGP